jgi:hypothetical protein
MTLRLNGSSSGYTEIDAPAAAGSNTLTLPTSNGSAEQFLKNSGTAGELEFSSMVEDSSGRLLVGSTSGRTNWNDSTIEPKIIVEGAGDNDSTAVCVVSNSGSTNGASRGALLTLARTKGTTDGSNTAVDENTALGMIEFKGNDGTSFTTAAKILAAVDGTPGADDMPGRLVFSTTVNGAATPTDRARITNQGRFDIFASSSTDAHFVSSGASAGTAIDLITGKHSATGIENANNGTNCFTVKTNGNVQNTNNSYGSISDVKLKENIADASSQWDDIKGLRVRNYNFKEETGNPTHTQIGVVAQELETVSPGLVYETPDRDSEGTDLGTVTKSVNYSVLYMKAVKALQEAQTRIETLETQNTAQQTQIDDLLARVTALEAA